MKMDNEHIPLPPPMSTPIQFVLELCIMLWIVLWYHVIRLATEITFVLKASQRHHPCIGIRYYVMKLGTEILLYQIPLVSPPLRQHHHHPPCIMFWNTNIIPMHNMTTGKLGTEILLHQIPSVPPPLRQYHHHPPCIMFWNTNIIPIHNMTTGKFLNRSLTENWPAVVLLQPCKSIQRDCLRFWACSAPFWASICSNMLCFAILYSLLSINIKQYALLSSSLLPFEHQQSI